LLAAKGELSDEEFDYNEPMFSISYDPLENPNQATMERDLEDLLMQRALRFLDNNLVGKSEICYLVGLEDKSAREVFTMEESLTELSELAGAAGLSVVGSTYQRVNKPNIEYFIGQGKTKDIQRALAKLRCTCVIFDAELTPSQQKNLELSLNQQPKNARERQNPIKVIDRTALILDIFAQHAKTKEGQLQVQLALLTYRLPRLTNMWSHLERQSAGAKGRSNGGVGLRGPGEKQLESDKRQMKSKISALKKQINSVRVHRSRHRRRRKQLGVPVVALVGYTNSGKSTLLNSFTMGVSGSNTAATGSTVSSTSASSRKRGVFAADMLFATLDPTTRMIRAPGLKNPDILLTDTVGFIQKLPTNLIAAFRATLEEISEADVLLHVTDISNETWRKQEAAVLTELANMGLANKPVVTVWNKIDAVPETKEFFRFEAGKRSQTVAMSARTGEGSERLLSALEAALSSQMQFLECRLPYDMTPLMSTLHSLSILEEVTYTDDGIYVRGHVPRYLCEQIVGASVRDVEDDDDDDDDGAPIYESSFSVGNGKKEDDGDDEDDFGITKEDLLAYARSTEETQPVEGQMELEDEDGEIIEYADLEGAFGRKSSSEGSAHLRDTTAANTDPSSSSSSSSTQAGILSHEDQNRGSHHKQLQQQRPVILDWRPAVAPANTAEEILQERRIQELRGFNDHGQYEVIRNGDDDFDDKTPVDLDDQLLRQQEMLQEYEHGEATTATQTTATTSTTTTSTTSSNENRQEPRHLTNNSTQQRVRIVVPADVQEIDWKGLSKGRHRAVKKFSGDS